MQLELDTKFPLRVIPEPCITFLYRANFVANIHQNFPKIPVSLYHQALFTIIRSNIDDLSSLPKGIQEDLKDWKTFFPRTFFLDDGKLIEIPIFLKLANYIYSGCITTLSSNMKPFLSKVYDTLDTSPYVPFRGLKRFPKEYFLRVLFLALKHVKSILNVHSQMKWPFKNRPTGHEEAFRTLMKACLTGSYPLVLYWIKIICINIDITYIYPKLILRKILEIYFNSLPNPPRTKNEEKLLDPSCMSPIKLICHLLEGMYGLDILHNQKVVAAKLDNLGVIKSICSKTGEYIRPLTDKRTNIRIGRLVYEDSRDIIRTACREGSLSTIKYLLPRLANNWKENQPYACLVAESGKMPALEYFLQRKHLISPMIIGAITAANIRSFAFLFLVMARNPFGMEFLGSKFGNHLKHVFNQRRPNPCHYIILRYLTITKLDLGMNVYTEIGVAASLNDTQLMEYINFRTRNEKDLTELQKKIGFNLDCTWVDQLDSVNRVRQAAFEMLLESKYYTKRGISRLINGNLFKEQAVHRQSDGNLKGESHLIDLGWALDRSIKVGNEEITKAIKVKLNYPILPSTKSISLSKRPREVIKNRKVTSGRPKKITKLS